MLKIRTKEVRHIPAPKGVLCTYDYWIYEYVQNTLEPIDSFSRFIVASTYETIEEKGSKKTTFARRIVMICSRSKKHVRVVGDMIKSRVKNIIKLTRRDPHFGIICERDETLFNIVVDDEVVRGYLEGPLNIENFWDLNERSVVRTAFDNDEPILCRMDSCAGALAGFFINLDSSHSSERDERWNEFLQGKERSIAGYYGGALIVKDLHWSDSDDDDDDDDDDANVVNRLRPNRLKQLMNTLDPDTIVVETIDLDGLQYDDSSINMKLASHYALREKLFGIVNSVDVPMKNRHLMYKFNKIIKIQTAEMLSMLAFIKLAGEIVLPKIAPAYRPIALALDG